MTAHGHGLGGDPVFYLRSFYYAIFVALRMMPILLATAFTLYLFIRLLIGEPLALILVVGAIYIPLLLFLYLNALRAALVAMRETGPPVVQKLWQGTIRLMRFSFLLNNLVMGLIGMGGTVLLLIRFKPELWHYIFREMEFSNLLDPRVREYLLTEMPMAVLPIWALALSVSIGIVGTSAAATAAWVAERGPNHDALWGVTEEFRRLFLLGILTLFVPAVTLTSWAGRPFDGMIALMSLPREVLIGVPVYLCWTICVIAAGKALAYAQTARNIAERFEAEQEAMLGTHYSTDDLRAIRQERMRRTRMDQEEIFALDEDETGPASHPTSASREG